MTKSNKNNNKHNFTEDGTGDGKGIRCFCRRGAGGEQI